MTKNNFFFEVESVIGEKIPECLIYILNESGFNTKLTLETLNSEYIKQIEFFFNANYEKLCHGLSGSIYENIEPFSIVPGHRALIERIPQFIAKIKTDCSSIFIEPNRSSNQFSYILKLLIETAERNYGRAAKSYRYNEKIQYFATYIYLMCGRACYETLSANMPIPQANTIRKISKYIKTYY